MAGELEIRDGIETLEDVVVLFRGKGSANGSLKLPEVEWGLSIPYPYPVTFSSNKLVLVWTERDWLGRFSVWMLMALARGVLSSVEAFRGGGGDAIRMDVGREHLPAPVKYP